MCAQSSIISSTLMFMRSPQTLKSPRTSIMTFGSCLRRTERLHWPAPPNRNRCGGSRSMKLPRSRGRSQSCEWFAKPSRYPDRGGGRDHRNHALPTVGIPRRVLNITMTFETWFQSTHANIPVNSANAVLSLAGEGATVPFIARYRKEHTGALDEVAIQNVIDAKERWDETIKRQTFIVEEIERQGKLTDELKEKILSTFNLDSLEDIYLPYKQKRKTKATLAKEAGLEPFADWIWDCGHGSATPEPGQTVEIFALAFYNPEKNINDAEAAIAGALDILTERLSETQELREFTRKTVFERGVAKSVKSEKAKEHSKYERYFDHHEPIQSLLKPENSHRYLAMRRGWTEEELTLTICGAPRSSR